MRNSETTTSQCDENAWVREFEHKQMASNARPLNILELIELKRNKPKLTTFEHLTLITSEAENEIN